MTSVKTLLGTVQVNQFTSKHSRNNGHADPARNPALMDALARNEFMVVDRLDSQWRGHPAINFVLLIQTVHTPFLVVLKSIKTGLLLITAYPARARQVRRYTETI